MPLSELPFFPATRADFFHAKGMQARQTPQWRKSYLIHRLERGASGADLWIEAWLGARLGHLWCLSAFSELVDERPLLFQKALAEPEALTQAFLTAQQDFSLAALTWRPPSTHELRGWSAKYSDETITELSRFQFEKMADWCQSALQSSFESVVIESLFCSASPTLQSQAIQFLSLFQQIGAPSSVFASPENQTRLLTACAGGGSITHLRKLLRLTCNPELFCRQIGELYADCLCPPHEKSEGLNEGLIEPLDRTLRTFMKIATDHPDLGQWICDSFEKRLSQRSPDWRDQAALASMETHLFLTFSLWLAKRAAPNIADAFSSPVWDAIWQSHAHSSRSKQRLARHLFLSQNARPNPRCESLALSCFTPRELAQLESRLLEAQTPAPATPRACSDQDASLIGMSKPRL